MTRKVAVLIAGGVPHKVVQINPDATYGATIGQNVFGSDGELWVPPVAGASNGVTVQVRDENVTVGSFPVIDFVGSAVEVTALDGRAIVTVDVEIADVDGLSAELTSLQDQIDDIDATVFVGVDPIDVTGSIISGTVQVELTGVVDLDHGGTGADYSSVAAHLFFAAPSAAPGSPTFRAIVAGDLPDLSGTYVPLSYLDTDTTLAANSDTKVATQKAVKTYVDNSVAGLLDLKGGTACAANPNYPSALKGDAYYVTSAGKIGGASGKSVDVGDVFVASADNAGGTEAAVGTSWFVLEHNLTGALIASNNLSDLTSAVTARVNLGLVIGTNVQAYDATLAALASADWASNSLAIGSGADTVAQVTFAANTFPARGASGNLVAKTISTDALSLVASANYAAMRSALSLGTAALQNTGTSGTNLGFLDGSNTHSGDNTFSGTNTVTGLKARWHHVLTTTQTSVAQDHGGIILRAVTMNTTNKYTGILGFGSSDAGFTTSNPKLLAGIVGYATEAYTSDTTGGMGLEFFGSANGPGTAPALTSLGTWTVADGLTFAVVPAVGTRSFGDSTTKAASTAFVQAAVDAGPSGAGAWTLYPSTADFTKTNNTLATVTGMSCTLDVGTHHIRGRVAINTANATMNYKHRFNFTGTSTFDFVHRRQTPAGEPNGTNQETTALGAYLNTDLSVTAATSGRGFLEFDIWVVVSVSGTFSFQFAQNTTNASNATVYAGSYFERKQVA